MEGQKVILWKGIIYFCIIHFEVIIMLNVSKLIYKYKYIHIKYQQDIIGEKGRKASNLVIR